MVEKRSASSPPARERTAAATAAAASAAASAARAAADAAVLAAEAAEEANREGHDPSTTTAVNPFPPDPNEHGQRLWYVAEGYKGLDEGIYTTVSLRNRGIMVNEAHPTGQCDGWKTCDPSLRKAASKGAATTTIYWR